VELMEERVLLAATITVNSALDTNDPNDWLVTFREAILIANGARAVGGSEAGQVVGTLGTGAADRDTIAFNIPGAGVRTINLTSALPTITDPVTIDGYTQPGSSPNTLPDGDNAILLIELNRGNLTVNGLTITAGNSVVRGLVINRNISFVAYAIEITTRGGNLIEGNFLGPDATGTADVGTQGFGAHILDVADNTIGGTIPRARNLIWGSSGTEGGGSPSTSNAVARRATWCRATSSASTSPARPPSAPGSASMVWPSLTRPATRSAGQRPRRATSSRATTGSVSSSPPPRARPRTTWCRATS
jgi:hypothetical protein